MRRSLVALCLLGASCGGVAGDDSLDTAQQPIINGHICGTAEAPSAVGVIGVLTLGTTPATQTTRLLCSGVLIAPDVVLSAAHCVDKSVLGNDLGHPVTTAQFYVSFHTDLSALLGTSTQLPTDAVLARSVQEDEDFGNSGATTGIQGLHDIGLLYLDKAQTVQPEVVITATEATQVASMAPVVIAGWGQQTNAMNPPAGTEGVLRCADSFVNQIGNSEMQIGGDASTGYTCHGDSGGPAYMTVQTSFKSKRRVVGVTSHAFDNAYCDQGAVDTRVDAYLTWLDGAMKSACVTKLRAWCNVQGIIPPDYLGSTTNGTGTQGAGGGSAGGYTPKKSGCNATPTDLLALLGFLGLIRRRTATACRR